MLTFRVTDDVIRVTKSLSALGSRHIPRSTYIALTKSAKQGKDDVVASMPKVFDRPTRYTLNSLFVRAATKETKAAEVMIKDFASKGTPAIKFLAPEIYGGERRLKRYERALQAAGVLPHGMYAIPTKAAPTDAYGNVPARIFTQILSALRSSSDPYQNRTAASAKRARGRQAQWFAVTKREGGLKPGIYQRFGFAHGSAVKPIFIFTHKVPTYRQRLPFFKTVEATVSRTFAAYFDQALSEALAKWGE